MFAYGRYRQISYLCRNGNCGVCSGIVRSGYAPLAVFVGFRKIEIANGFEKAEAVNTRTNPFQGITVFISSIKGLDEISMVMCFPLTLQGAAVTSPPWPPLIILAIPPSNSKDMKPLSPHEIRSAFLVYLPDTRCPQAFSTSAMSNIAAKNMVLRFFVLFISNSFAVFMSRRQVSMYDFSYTPWGFCPHISSLKGGIARNSLAI
jgi:hypothetical protein